MANTNRRKRKQAEYAYVKEEAGAQETGAEEQAPINSPGEVDPIANSSLRAAVSTIFQSDESLRQAITANLKERSAESKVVAERVQIAFAKFNPIRLSDEQITQQHFLAPGEDLVKAQRAVIDQGVDAMRSAKVKPSITLRNSGDLKEMIKETTREGESLTRTMELETLFNFITLKPDAGPSSVYTECEAELEAEKILKKAEGAPDDKDGKEPSEEDSTPEPRSVEQLVKDTVNLQMETATSPESQLRFSVPNRANQGKVQSNIDSFELRAGPSDVTSYHDFYNLQIAFAHVWSRIFDSQLTSLGQELYHEYVKLKEFTGNTDDDPPISTLDDLRKLMAEIRKLSQTMQDNTPSEVRGEGDGSTNIKSSTDAKDLFTKVVGVPLSPTGAILGAIIDALSTAGNKPRIRWADFPGPLPGRNDAIELRIDENVAPEGFIQIKLEWVDSSLWKGIDYQEFDSKSNRFISAGKISNNDRDRDLWNPASPHMLTLATYRVSNGLLEFDSQEVVGGVRVEGEGAKRGRYLLGDLDEKLKDRTRVTFKWLVG